MVQVPLNRAAAMILAGMLLLPVGCGLSEYNAEFAKQQERIEQFDKDNKILGKSIKWPEKKDDKAGTQAGTKAAPPRVEIFLRMPREISTKEEEVIPNVLYRYPYGSGSSSSGSTSPAGMPSGGTAKSNRNSGFEEVWLGVEFSKKREEFVADCAVGAPFFASVDLTKLQKAPPVPSYGRKPLQYDTISVPGPQETTYQVYFYQEGTYQVAIVYRIYTASEKSAQVTEPIQGSLRSLTVGPGANQMFSLQGS